MGNADQSLCPFVWTVYFYFVILTLLLIVLRSAFLFYFRPPVWRKTRGWKMIVCSFNCETSIHAQGSATNRSREIGENRRLNSPLRLFVHFVCDILYSAVSVFAFTLRTTFFFVTWLQLFVRGEAFCYTDTLTFSQVSELLLEKLLFLLDTFSLTFSFLKVELIDSNCLFVLDLPLDLFGSSRSSHCLNQLNSSKLLTFEFCHFKSKFKESIKLVGITFLCW